MARNRAYLDYNATAPLIAAARDAVVNALMQTGNPSSVHLEGRATKAILEAARRDVAALVNSKPDHVVFTSGATEAASTLLTPHLRWERRRCAFRSFMSAQASIRASLPADVSGRSG